MTTLHTFGCSITQGFALPDVVKPAVDAKGRLLTQQEIIDQGIHWSDIHLYQPSKYAWPQLLADRLKIPVINHARRGACFQQISRQCAVAAKDIKPDDIVIVMWTYLNRLSLQWPSRTSVPFCNVVDPNWNWRTIILCANRFFGLDRASEKTQGQDREIQQYIEESSKYQLHPLGTYNRYHNNLVLQEMTAGFLRSTGARVIHLSVEPETELDQLELARRDLDPSLQAPHQIPNPQDWYSLAVDHKSCWVILDPSIPPAENDMHPSQQHHRNFADHIWKIYFGEAAA